MTESNVEELAVMGGLAGLTSMYTAFTLHESVAKGYSPANDAAWRKEFPIHGGAAGSLMLMGGIGYSMGRQRITPEGMSFMGLGTGLILSDIKDLQYWFSTISDGLSFLLIAFLIGYVIGYLVRLSEESIDNSSISVA